MGNQCQRIPVFENPTSVGIRRLSRRVAEADVINAVTPEGATALEAPQITEVQSAASRAANGPDDRAVEVDQMAVFAGAAAYTVWSVAGAARRLIVDDVAAVKGEAFIVEEAVAVVALVAQGIGAGAFRGEILGVVALSLQEGIA